MKKLKRKEITLDTSDGGVRVKRNRWGIPMIRGNSSRDIAFALGWVHASDRQIQSQLMKVVLKGEAAEKLSGSKELIEADKYIRKANFFPDMEYQIAKLNPSVKEQLEAYAKGVNAYLAEHKPPFEFRLIGYKPQPWDITDSLRIGKVFGFAGLVELQAKMEKLILQMIQKGVSEERIRELFPGITEPIDYALLNKIKIEEPIIPDTVKWMLRLPVINASNNWAVSGRWTESGKPILCGDPHLEVARIPAIWQEIVMELPENTLKGVTIPGLPGLITGRNSYISWSPTYSVADTVDYRIEHCKDGKYQRGKEWIPFGVREETIKVKKAEPLNLTIYENEYGYLEGNPFEEGYYLVLSWAGGRDCGAGEFNCMIDISEAKTVEEAMEKLKLLDAATFNWVIADRDGNIGYQMSGRVFKRAEGVSGLIPIPAWDEQSQNNGFVSKDDLPSSYNPEEGFIVTANDNLNHLGIANPITLPMAPYRAERIKERIEEKIGREEKFDIEYMKSIQYDLYSKEAERFMEMIRPLLPDTEKGKILKEWDCRYDLDSMGATLFEAVYMALIKLVFGENGLGREIIDFLIDETSLFIGFFYTFDSVLFKTESAWYNGTSREEWLSRAIEEGLRVDAVPYGSTRRLIMRHLLFGGKLPSWLGFDLGPFPLPGSRATVPQAQISSGKSKITAAGVSYRFITDMSTTELHTNLPGGPTDRRFSGLYKNDVSNWLKGKYKII